MITMTSRKPLMLTVAGFIAVAVWTADKAAPGAILPSDYPLDTFTLATSATQGDVGQNMVSGIVFNAPAPRQDSGWGHLATDVSSGTCT